MEKRLVTDYNLNTAYTSRRILGLPSKTEVYGLNQETNLTELVSKTTYGYDDENSFAGTEQNISSVIQHDNTSYSASLTIGRGNLTSTTRCDAALSSGTTCGGGVSSTTLHNTAGAVVKQIATGSAAGSTREVKISYADSFNDGTNNRNTFAYPTTLTTAGITSGSEVSSFVKYRYDTGANVWAKSPAPAGNTSGKETERLFDSIGRLNRETLVNNGAYTRYQYFSSQVQSKVFTTVKSGAGEVEFEAWMDGAGRVLRSRTELPNSTGGWSGSFAEYDILGRVNRSTAPTEINASWQAAGDSVDTQGNAIWLWTSAEYDWKGRIKREINTDGTDKTIDYDGCGCTGIQTTTMKGEEIIETDWQGQNPVNLGRRTQKIYTDIQGRNYKTEIYNWNGSGTPYATTVSLFNGRDQAVSVKRYAGAAGVGTPQVTSITYDGHGRLRTQHRPENQTSAL